MPCPRSLSRRDLLRAGGVSLAGGLAGCESLVGQRRRRRTSRATTGTTENETTQPTATFEPTENPCQSPPSHHVELLGSADAPEDANASIEATMLRERVDDRETARFRVSIENGGTWDGIRMENGDGCRVFDGTESRAGFRIFPEGESPLPFDRPGDCWTAPYPADRTRDTGPGESLRLCRVIFDGDGSYSSVFELWDDSRTEGYFRPGEYRFATTVVLTRGEDSSGDGRAIDWWLDLRITQPDS